MKKPSSHYTKTSKSHTPPAWRAYVTRLSTGILRTSLLISAFFAADKVLGFVRQILLIRAFGNSAAADAYYASNNIPDAITSLIAGGVTLAFIPVLAKTIELKNTAKTWRLFNTVFNIGLLFMVATSIIIWFQADLLVRASWGITPGFTPKAQALTADLMRLNLIAGIFFTASGLIMSGLQAHKRFFLTLLAPLLYTIVQIGALLFFVPRWGVHGLVYGIILSGVVHFAVQLPGLIKLGWRWHPVIDLRDPEFRSVFVLLIVRLITMLAIQLMFIARDNFGSRVGSGAVSALGYGWFIMQLPETLIGTAIGTSLLPTLAGLIAEKQFEAFRALIRKSTRIIVLSSVVITLATVAMAPFALRYIPLLIHTKLNIAWIIAALIGFMVGLAGQSLLEVIARAYYALGDANMYLYGTIARLGLLLACTVLLMPRLGILGIALADSIATTLVSGFLYFHLMHRKNPR